MELVKYFSSSDLEFRKHTENVNDWILDMEEKASKANEHFYITSRNLVATKTNIITEIWYTFHK